MRLSKLEIKGFKSFGNQAGIQFNEGVTCIVGPNGCGKSNVVDSIRWVLGEQKTRSLRSDKMENIIFNGTKKRKPAPTAEVSLTFDNDRQLLPPEYTQVTITRRYHRTGDSEYLINDVRCRLKDIHNLFLDTGIGPDSYAIIELKKVDEILNDKEQSRRSLFEKAAGISKFKMRKKESFSQLEQVDNDLSRVGDLLFEIEKNLRSLERQAKQAERYFKLQEKYRQHSLMYAQKAIRRQREVHQSLQTRIREEEEKKGALQESISQQELGIEQHKGQLEHYEQALRLKQNQLREHKQQIKNLENEQKLVAQQISHLEEKNNNTRKLISEDIQDQVGIRKRLEGQSRQLIEVRDSLLQLSDELESHRETYEIQKEKTQEIQQRLRGREEIYQAKQSEIYTIKRDYEIKQTRLSSSRQEFEKTAQNIEQLRVEFNEYESQISAVATQLKTAKDAMQSLVDQEERQAEDINILEEQVLASREQVYEVQRRLATHQNEYKFTKSLLENLEGFPEALQFLQQNPDWSVEAPLLSDVVACEEVYRKAVEAYLDPWVNYYVLAHEADALRAIALLQEAQKGKASFFILDHFQAAEGRVEEGSDLGQGFFGGVKPSELMYNPEEGELIPALEILHYAPEYKDLLNFLLQEVYLVKDLGQIPEKRLANATYVSLSGEIVSRAESITGGSIGTLGGGRLGRAQNLEKLQDQIQVLEEEETTFQEQLQAQSGQLAALKQNQDLKEAYRQANRQVNEINERYVSLKSKMEQLKQIIEKNLSRRGEVQDQVYQLEEALKELEPQLNEDQDELYDLEEEIAQLREQFEIENETLTEQSTRFNAQNLLFHQQENRVKSLEQDQSYQEEKIQTLSQRIQENESTLVQVEEDLEKLLENQEQNEGVVEELHGRTEDYELNVSGVEKQYFELKGQIGDLEKFLKEQQRQKDTLESLINQLRNQMHETSLELNSIQERLSVEFQVDLDSLFDQALEDPEGRSEEELKEFVQATKLKMERIGTINPMAMDAFQEMEERHGFISEQKNDLETSKESLLQTIEEMEGYARTAFMEAFEQIRENFIKVFRSLFSAEDQADLVLSDPENPLESKIEIVAQPKGKRPLTIDQLSGGEKTLTSTSLLFALYLLKPAPFCIFDEVDAPLDDANTEKFNKIIKEFSRESQFILVTHNKRTMSSADVMYGVTMIEDGVSSVVPVDLRNVEEEILR